jgi:hypothetical protein
MQYCATRVTPTGSNDRTLDMRLVDKMTSSNTGTDPPTRPAAMRKCNTLGYICIASGLEHECPVLFWLQEQAGGDDRQLNQAAPPAETSEDILMKHSMSV